MNLYGLLKGTLEQEIWYDRYEKIKVKDVHYYEFKN